MTLIRNCAAIATNTNALSDIKCLLAKNFLSTMHYYIIDIVNDAY
jgi:hypothetical protein